MVWKDNLLESVLWGKILLLDKHYQAVEKTKQNTLIYFNYFGASLLNADNLPKLYLRKCFFFPQYTAYSPPGCARGRHRGNWTLLLACRAAVEPAMAPAAVANVATECCSSWGEKGREQHLTGGATKLLIHQLHRTNANKPRAGLPNPVSMQHRRCSDPPPVLSYKYTHLNKWFLFAGAKSRIFQHNSGDHDDIREF